MVEVRLFAAARAAVGSPTWHGQPGPLAGLLDELERQHPSFAAVRPRCSYLVDEVAVHAELVDVADGSCVDVLPPFAGG